MGFPAKRIPGQGIISAWGGPNSCSMNESPAHDVVTGKGLGNEILRMCVCPLKLLDGANGGCCVGVCAMTMEVPGERKKTRGNLSVWIG